MKRNLYKDLEKEMYLFNNGEHFESYRLFGSKRSFEDELNGWRFTVWAPNAKNVHLAGDFSEWNPIQMEKIGKTGAWSVFDPTASEGDCYKYLIENQDGHSFYKIDPYAFAYEVPPKDASLVQDLPNKKWRDGHWFANKKRKPIYNRPLNIYEVHFASWRRHPDGTSYSFKELAETLIPYVKEMGYTHIEFMPLMEHPLEASWGYQITGYYAVAARYGNVEEFRDFVEEAHRNGIGIILDWVPGHFCRNDYALAYFDGTPTFEYQDSNRADNKRWGSLNFDLGKKQVHSFLISNAIYWMEEFHIDGIRVDAVSNMLYLDYDEGPWTPNEDGSNHNRQGMDFLQKLNTVVFARDHQMLMIAEESTSWANVTRPIEMGGLGFNYKWNMGWMNDTLEFFSMDPFFRKDHFNLLTFSFMYAFNENFILPISHDEVVHGKRSLLGRIPGDRYNQFATLRNLQAYMLAHPGKKLNFMGNELGQFLEWRFYEELEWKVLNQEFNSEYHSFIKTLNQLYKKQKALYEIDDSRNGMELIDADNHLETVLSFIRKSEKERDFLIVISNFTPIERRNFVIGVPYEGTYEELLNTEMREFGGTWTKGQADMKTIEKSFNQFSYVIELTVPAMGTIYIRPKRIYGVNKK
ncbi:1,4-alpha-glucan branching protein GlgB [Jeotgalibaca ciconiae]|uniref:1,4-alpha-glucan branching enzyme GlgB n=1 Tax=Jeotgalibaca ciconiae TaxID=2496265 RepID=A0A3Q9BIQ5_9LACT|nr:1,4-alpha-glucan branching protein GlgB [Jeotgalibaca ciconiae]AZP03289.1 1,4-alpha-glucan branching protein GlgB [Jeotgalibaca ciconiae]